jgi:hypothetical protein
VDEWMHEWMNGWRGKERERENTNRREHYVPGSLLHRITVCYSLASTTVQKIMVSIQVKKENKPSTDR